MQRNLTIRESYTQNKLRKKMLLLFNEIDEEICTLEDRVTTLERTVVSRDDLERIKKDIIKKIKKL
jgi:hypothetical protein